jgi:hypothetical protein
MLSGPMTTREGERAFARRAFGAEGDRFFDASCSGCHVTGCGDCHGNGAHPTAAPTIEACLRCHHGYSVGWEYVGRAPREAHSRYQRGAVAQGERFLSMLPDVHFERGMTCADCHPMASLHGGGRAKSCRDCHPSPATNPEHAIAAHMKTMECVACHAAWAAQEYGTFLVRPASAEQDAAFAALPKRGPWRTSAQLKRQDQPPLGLDAAGLVAPIRPRFILVVTDPARGWENHIAAAEWRTTSPHTIRRGAVTCGGCHDQRRRFILESGSDRIYRPDEDGLALHSWWDRKGQQVVNGSFLPRERYDRMNAKTLEYARQAVNRWKRLLDHAAPRSGR